MFALVGGMIGTAIDGRRNVRDLARKTSRQVLEVCHAILALVDAGAVDVGPTPATPAARREATRKRPVEVAPEAPYGPGVESPHPGPTGGVADDLEREFDPADKGRYLSAFSGLRDA